MGTGAWGKELGSPLASADPWDLEGEPRCVHWATGDTSMGEMQLQAGY